MARSPSPGTAALPAARASSARRCRWRPRPRPESSRLLTQRAFLLDAGGADRDLADLTIGVNAQQPQLVVQRVQRRLGRAQIFGRDRERDLSLAPLLAGLTLYDRVDVAVGRG